MSAQYLTLNEPRYVPKYNTLDTNLINTVDTEIQKQGQFNTDAASKMFGNLQEQVIGGLSGLDQEFQVEAAGLVDQSRANIDRVFEEKGARHAMPSIQREAERISGELRPYQQVASQAQAFKERLQDDDIRKNVSAGVRRLMESKASVERNPDTNKLEFKAPDTKILDVWKDLDEVARQMSNEIEPFVTESVLHGQPVIGSDGRVMEIDGDIDAFFSRMKTKTMGYPDEPVQERVHQILMSRLINNPDIQEQLALQVEANGEEVTKENIINEALRIVAPHVAAKATAEQTYSSPIQNPKFFAALNNGIASGNGVFTIPINTTAGQLPYSNPISLDNEINSYKEAYDAVLNNAIEEGVIEQTSNGYNVLKQGQYNSYYANQFRELNIQTQKIEGRKSRLFTDALNAFYKERNLEITEDNYESFMENLSADIEQSNQAVSELITEISRGSDVSNDLRYAARQANISDEELVRNIINGQSLESMGLFDFINDKRLPHANSSVEKIRNRFTNWHDYQLNQYSKEYQTYSNLLKEDAKGRTTTTNIIKTLDNDINRIGEESFNSSLRLSGGADIRFFDINNAGQSIYEKYDESQINNSIETAEFEGYAYHPDDGRPIIVSTININGNQHTIQMDMTSDIITSMNLLSNDQAYKSHLNNQINTIASNPDRRGRILIPFQDTTLELSLSMPYRNVDSKGVPITSGSIPIELDLSRKGQRDIRKFRSPEELIGFIMHQLPQMISPKNETE